MFKKYQLYNCLCEKKTLPPSYKLYYIANTDSFLELKCMVPCVCTKSWPVIDGL